MILTHEEEIVLRALGETPDGKLFTGSLSDRFRSGAQILTVLKLLNSKGLVYLKNDTIHLTQAGMAEVDHRRGRARRRVHAAVRPFGHVLKLIKPAVTFLVGTIVGFLASNLSPSFYCPLLPSAVATVLTPCEAATSGENQ
ncbi:MAG: hypothetical protein WA784_15305 [Albidovulum sp.]